MTDFRFQNPAPAPLTRAQIEARFPEPPDGWTAEDDVALWEGLFMGLGFEDIAVKRGGKADQWRARFFAFRDASGGRIGLNAQTRWLELARNRAGA